MSRLVLNLHGWLLATAAESAVLGEAASAGVSDRAETRGSSSAPGLTLGRYGDTLNRKKIK